MIANEMHELPVCLRIAYRGPLEGARDCRLANARPFCEVVLGAALSLEELANFVCIVRSMQ
jgi:hypothetical protein